MGGGRRKSRSGAATIVAVRGEIDISNAPQLRACRRACLSDGCAGMTLDVKELTFLDGNGPDARDEAPRAAPPGPNGWRRLGER
jgi:hypothetical protein